MIPPHIILVAFATLGLGVIIFALAIWFVLPRFADWMRRGE